MSFPRTYGLTHLAIVVNDVRQTLAFYRNVFDMNTMYQEEGFIQLTTPGCNDILVFEERKDKTIGQTGGILHFGFRLKDPGDIDDIIDRIMTAGGTIIERGEFVPGSPFVFFRDPDGYEVEVWYELPEPGSGNI